MSETASPVLLTVLAATFDNQAAAFEALRAEAEKIEIDIRPTQTDVIREAHEVRLAHYFRPAVKARIEAAMPPDNTVILLFPSVLTARPAFPPSHSTLRLIGRFAGILGHPV